jgi:hypothetical protein
VKRSIVALIAFAVLGLPIASTAQCPVEPGWWVYENPSGSIKLKFHVKPEGTKVDSLEFTLHAVCSVSGTRKYTCSGKTITCAPWAFTWSLACDAPSWTDGFDLTVTFTDEQNSTGVLDIVNWFNGCTVCHALEGSSVVGTAVSTWGGIKAQYDSQ